LASRKHAIGDGCRRPASITTPWRSSVVPSRGGAALCQLDAVDPVRRLPAVGWTTLALFVVIPARAAERTAQAGSP